MGAAIGALLSPAVGVAISPFPIVGLILILLSKKAKVNSLFYTLGWVLGNLIVFLIAMIFMGAISSGGEPGMIARIVYIVLGLLLFVVAGREFHNRPKNGEEVKTPGWFEKMSAIKPLGATVFSFALAAVNPKNLLLSLTAGVGVGTLNLSVGENVAATIIFLLIASSTIIVPTIAFLISGDRLNKTLDVVRDWLIKNNAIIMAVLLLFIGLSVISKAF
ncbi:GAP family protein [Culicoidibacter larvae]|uniref:GAP family protein n=1 Tax=Culicoidibacter larvae TaxID=2579976 RepID=A0A5R8QIJ5_9FIRM|nr:GAP family protein [Culicoidibacter larvae]TLG77263.1 GAP family protein [Culicoidibacter larvae]